MLFGVVSVSCGIDRVLPVLRPVCVTHSIVLLLEFSGVYVGRRAAHAHVFGLSA